MVDHYYATDPETKEITRQYRDGASFVAMGKPHPLAFWTRHPHVERIEDSTDEDGAVTVRVWLKAPLGTEVGATGTVMPDRPADYLFYGAGLMTDTFWEGHPDIGYFEVFNFLGDDSMDDDGWNANVWLKGS